MFYYLQAFREFKVRVDEIILVEKRRENVRSSISTVRKFQTKLEVEPHFSSPNFAFKEDFFDVETLTNKTTENRLRVPPSIQ